MTAHARRRYWRSSPVSEVQPSTKADRGVIVFEVAVKNAGTRVMSRSKP